MPSATLVGCPEAGHRLAARRVRYQSQALARIRYQLAIDMAPGCRPRYARRVAGGPQVGEAKGVLGGFRYAYCSNLKMIGTRTKLWTAVSPRLAGMNRQLRTVFCAASSRRWLPDAADLDALSGRALRGDGDAQDDLAFLAHAPGERRVGRRRVFR